MSDDVTTAATIASLRAEVERLKAENERLTDDAIKELIDSAAIREFSYHHQGDSIEARAVIQSPLMSLIGGWITGDFKRTSAVNFLEQELMFTARDGEHRYTVNIRKSGGKTEAQVCGELRAELAERNAYAERLLAENVRLSNEASELRSEVSAIGTRLSMEQEDHAATRKELDAVVILLDGQRVLRKEAEARAESLSHSIIASCTGSGCLNAHELRVALNTARERAGVLEAEVKACRLYDEAITADEQEVGWHAKEACRRETDRTHALDAAKFGGEK